MCIDYENLTGILALSKSDKFSSEEFQSDKFKMNLLLCFITYVLASSTERIDKFVR